jgi:hypothetical protein
MAAGVDPKACVSERAQHTYHITEHQHLLPLPHIDAMPVGSSLAVTLQPRGLVAWGICCWEVDAEGFESCVRGCICDRHTHCGAQGVKGQVVLDPTAQARHSNTDVFSNLGQKLVQIMILLVQNAMTLFPNTGQIINSRVGRTKPRACVTPS